jgi:TonB family protein
VLMLANRLKSKITKSFILAILTAIMAHYALAQCKPPKYREGRIIADSKSEIVMSISMRIEDFAPERLICLAEVMKQRYRDRKSISIIFFSSHNAALIYRASTFNYDPVMKEAEAQMHGAYLYDKDKQADFVDIYPEGGESGINLDAFRTKIELPVSSKPQCRLQISNRCLLALNDITYPTEAEKARITGTVTLAGTISRNGKMAGVKIAGTNITLTNGKNLLADAALQNLKTWQFEQSKHKDSFRITYSYAINVPAGRTGQLELRPELPNYMHISIIPFKDNLPQ